MKEKYTNMSVKTDLWFKDDGSTKQINTNTYCIYANLIFQRFKTSLLPL